MLKVTIHSFGFQKSGIPHDPTGNGGGFVFDCRAIENPGCYQEYKQYTGKDAKVIKFLEKQAELDIFLTNVKILIDMTINHHQKRKFTNLLISFGCTGGRHRSVYCADKIADSLKQEGVYIQVIHNDLPYD